MQGWGAFSEERTVELSFACEDLGARKKIQKCGWFESGEEQEVSKVGGREAAGSKYPSNSEALFGRELSSSRAWH